MTPSFPRRLAALAGIVTVAALAAVGPAARAEVQADLVAQGRELVQANCSKCHAIGTEPKSPHEKAPSFAAIAERYPSENLAEALAEGIVAGHPDMPVFVMKTEQIEAFLAYLDSLAPPQPAK